MWLLRIIVCALALQLNAIQFIDLPANYAAVTSQSNVQRRLLSPNLPSKNIKEVRKYWIHQRQGDSDATQHNEPPLQTTTPTPEPVTNPPANDMQHFPADNTDENSKADSANHIKNHPADTKDENLKAKIATLVLQTMHDTERRLKTVNSLKARFKNKPPYKIGFILSLIKKSRDVMNELFNVAVKHREKWKALEELKIFELIVHTNVDTTNLVRRLVEEHVNFLNTTNRDSHRKGVLLM